jgi:gas vesicle protein
MSNREYESRDTNQTRNEESSNSFLLGALIGGLAGAVTALLLAPKSGKELRRILNIQAGSIMDKTTELGGHVMNKSSDLVSKTSSLSQGFVLQSSELLNKVKGKTTNQDEESDVTFIPIHNPKEISTSNKSADLKTLDSSDIKKKLEEAQKAFEEEENKVKL